jgi:aspartate ammonia-lyase
VTAGPRVERDSLGEVEVPAGALYGAHTVRAAANFRVSGFTLRDRPELVEALVGVKIAAARANAELGVLEPKLAAAIVEAGREVLAGRWRGEFPLEVVQGGGGTATNMNVNEVLANRAAELLGGARGTYELVHPNDHVNRSQSTNDVYTTALQLAVLTVAPPALEGFELVAATLDRKARESGSLERLGRTCLQDALPVPAAETLRAHVHAVRRTVAALAAALQPLLAVPLGATAIGTGLGAPAGYRELAVRLLAEETSLALETRSPTSTRSSPSRRRSAA